MHLIEEMITIICENSISFTSDFSLCSGVYDHLREYGQHCPCLPLVNILQARSQHCPCLPLVNILQGV